MYIIAYYKLISLFPLLSQYMINLLEPINVYPNLLCNYEPILSISVSIFYKPIFSISTSVPVYFNPIMKKLLDASSVSVPIYDKPSSVYPYLSQSLFSAYQFSVYIYFKPFPSIQICFSPNGL